MKISYRTHPIIERLEKKKLGILSGNPQDYELMKRYRDLFKGKFEAFSSNLFKIYCLTDPFKDAFHAASKKLLNSTLWVDVEDGDYCFINRPNAICIKVKNDKTNGIIDCEVLSLTQFHDKKAPPLLECFGEAALVYDFNNTDNGKMRSPGFSGFESKVCDELHEEKLVNRLGTYMVMILFIKYADLELKELPAGQKTKGIDCKYINETSSNITILDSKWFTTLVKSDAFKVRGHFRLQPKKKDGEWTKELIWINDFEKSGYTAPARKLAMQHE